MRATQWPESLPVQRPHLRLKARRVLANAPFIGKQTVYHVLQDPNDAASRDEIVAMEQEIADLRDQIARAKASEKILKANLASVNATMSTQDLRGSTTAFEQEKQRLLGRLDPLRSGTVKPASLEEKAVVDMTWKEWSENARVRKKICLDVWALVAEMLPDGKTRGELWVSRLDVDTSNVSLLNPS